MMTPSMMKRFVGKTIHRIDSVRIDNRSHSNMFIHHVRCIVFTDGSKLFFNIYETEDDGYLVGLSGRGPAGGWIG